VPCADELNLYSLTFDDFSLESDEMLLAAVSMFLDLGLVKKFNIEKEVSSLAMPLILVLVTYIFILSTAKIAGIGQSV
jgi:hypothetical protein